MIASLLPWLRRLRGDRRGVTVVEFAIVIVPLTITLMVLFDFGYRMYAQSLLEGTLHRAARMATVGDKTPAEIDAFIKEQMKLFGKNRDPEITKRSFYQFSGVNKCEQDLADPTAPAGSTVAIGNCRLDSGECYIDENRNNSYDQALGAGTSGLGQSDDIVFYTVTVRFRRLFPLGRFLGWASEEAVSANTVLRNQPYGAQSGLPTPTCPN